jgi:hypothetical protein
MFSIPSIGNPDKSGSAIGNDFSPTRYREVVLTVCH